LMEGNNIITSKQQGGKQCLTNNFHRYSYM
jgi:hypothetical protein